MDKLTKRQQQVLEMIKSEVQAGKPFPSLREISDAFDIKHKSGAASHIRALERKGYIQKSAQRISGFALTDQNCKESFRLVGVIPAGTPQHSYEQTDQQLSFNQDYFGGGSLIAVTVTGDSMTGDSICDGDIVIIKLQSESNSHDIVALRIDQDEFSLKRVKFNGEQAELISSNPAYAPRFVASSQVEVVGKLVGIVRKA